MEEDVQLALNRMDQRVEALTRSVRKAVEEIGESLAKVRGEVASLAGRQTSCDSDVRALVQAAEDHVSKVETLLVNSLTGRVAGLEKEVQTLSVELPKQVGRDTAATIGAVRTELGALQKLVAEYRREREARDKAQDDRIAAAEECGHRAERAAKGIN